MHIYLYECTHACVFIHTYLEMAAHAREGLLLPAPVLEHLWRRLDEVSLCPCSCGPEPGQTSQFNVQYTSPLCVLVLWLYVYHVRSVYIYIYIYIYIYTYIHIYIHMYETCTHTHTHTHTQLEQILRPGILVVLYIHIRTYIHACIHTEHTYIHTCMHTSEFAELGTCTQLMHHVSELVEERHHLTMLQKRGPARACNMSVCIYSLQHVSMCIKLEPCQYVHKAWNLSVCIYSLKFASRYIKLEICQYVYKAWTLPVCV